MTYLSSVNDYNSKPLDKTNFKVKPYFSNSKPGFHKTSLSSSSSVNQTCLYCSDSHLIFRCPNFAKLNSKDRREFILSKRACFNCLSTQHMRSSCKSKSSCRICSQRHHTLVHVDKLDESNVPREVETNTSCTLNAQIHKPSPSSSRYVLLGTVQMLVQDVSGNFQPIRGLVDSGSQISCITEDCVKRLLLPRSKYHIPIMGLSETPVINAKGLVSCILKPTNCTDSEIKVNAVILPRITNNMPSQRINSDLRSNFQHLDLADQNFDVPSRIDFLIGADIFPILFDGQRINVQDGLPIPYHSIFGWVLLGSIDDKFLNNQNETQAVNSHFCSSINAQSLDESLKSFWEIEETPSKIAISTEDQFCEDYFKETYSRNFEGRYIVKMPFKEDPPALGESYSTALRRLQYLERKLGHSPELKLVYRQLMTEYETLGHMIRLTNNTVETKYVIPHHGIFKHDTQPPKFRTVFDGSAKTSSGESLNDKLLPGPKLQKDISDLIFRFRLHKVVFTSDVCKMYRQILVHEDHQPYQIILWRSSPNQPVNRYALQTVTYGLTCSPFLAMRTLKQLVVDEGTAYPNAAKVILSDVFVDDIVTGAPTLSSALLLKDELINVFAKGGFELKKWSSNTPEFLNDIPLDNQEKPLLFDSEPSVKKILGLQWLPNSDAFTYNITTVECLPTKRNILSQVARIFDPLGWLAPTVLLAKQLIQKLWTEGLGWDDLPSVSIQEMWQTFVSEFVLLKSIVIPRFVLPTDFVELQLHGFSDASEKGYAGVVYLRVTHNDLSITTHLIIAKTRVAPLKTISIPRLELCAAQLLTILIDFCKSSLLNYSSQLAFSVHAWTDSTVVLNWIHTSPHLLKTFVANRVSFIQEKLSPSQWFHTPGCSNPADCASRGIMPSSLIHHPLWWNGPHWLCQTSENWPLQDYPLSKNLLEHRDQISTCNVITEPTALDTSLIERFSSLTKLKRVTAWIFRFTNNSIKKHHNQEQLCGPLNVSELNKALISLIKLTQNRYFSEDIESLKKKAFSKTQKLQQLDAFIDNQGVIRVGGRLRQSNLHFESKHPILLPKKCHLTSLIIDYYHIAHLHAGPKLLQTVISKQYWILSARNVIRARLSKCIRCVRFRASLPQPFMSDLPASRLQCNRPFLICGVDFAGPYQTKTSKLRNSRTIKSYLCIFVCFSTKAVHLEAVSSLSAEDFLASLFRFMSRRGMCSDIYSDMGTNFVAASKELNEMHRCVKRSASANKITDVLAEKGINWHFNPPSAPHFGGLWEAAVKSAKFHLNRVIGEQILTFEELTTLFTEVEAVLNSRPLCPLSSDPNEINVLTPGHFLIGDALVAPPQPDLSHLQLNHLSRWQLIRQAVQHFWRRWNSEYLHNLQQRNKWLKPTPNLKIGDLVLIRETNVPPLRWPTGRVLAVHPGKDGTVRVVTVRTSHGELLRPVVKLCLLPND